MGQKVPYTRIPGLTHQQQQQLDRDFSEAAKQLDGGFGPVRVPYTKIPGLDRETQRQIDRNFAELRCDCVDDDVEPGTILTSDSFTTTGPRPDGALLGFSDCTFGGGTPELWHDFSGQWQIAGSKAQKVAGSTTVYETTALNTDVANVAVQATMTATGSTVAAASIVARLSDDDNYYYNMLYRNGGGTYQLYLGKVVAGVDTVLAGPTAPSPGLTPGNAFTLELIVTDDAIDALYAGVSWATATDTDLLTGTYQGLLAIKNNVTDFDNFRVTAT